MGLRDITSPEAIVSAIREFDRIGRDEFLRKYGFGPARSYFLQHDGKAYDSKAIVGAAHGYQFPVPLTPDDFSGGEQAVARKLRSLGFSVPQPAERVNEPAPSDTSSGRNPTWNRDELIVVLASYVQWDGNPPGKRSSEIASLSEFLNALRQKLGTPARETLRNPNGVYMKLMNFRRFDPKYASQGKTGLSRGGRLEEQIWATFHPDPTRLQRTAEAIRSGFLDLSTAVDSLTTNLPFDDLYGLEEADEGRVLSVQHLRRERSAQLAKTKKERMLLATGKLACEVCHFDFHSAYGDRGAGFIECHHIKPLESLAGSAKTRLEDLALLCANCHRMIHARRPWFSLDMLREVRIIRPLDQSE